MSRWFKVVIIAVLAATGCRDEGTGNASACDHVANADKDFQTFLQNHPVGGAPDPQSQIAVLDHMKSELDAAIRDDPASDLADILTNTIEDASHAQANIAAATPITSADLRSDFNNLESLCAELKSSNVTTP